MKNTTVMGIVKSLLFSGGACFVFILLKCHPPSPHVMLDKITQLKLDINALDILNKRYAEDEIELRHDEQRIEDLEKQIRSMRESFEKTAHIFLQQREQLKEGNKHVEEAIFASAKFNSDRRLERVSVMHKLSDVVAKTHGEFNEEQHENFELRKMLDDMREEIEKAKSLRGKKAF